MKDLKTAARHRHVIAKGIKFVKKSNKISKKLKADVTRAQQEVNRAVSNYTLFVLQFFGYVLQKIVWIIVPAVPAEDEDEDNEYEYVDWIEEKICNFTTKNKRTTKKCHLSNIFKDW